MRPSGYIYRSRCTACYFLENLWCLQCGKTVNHYAVAWLFYNIHSWNERHQYSDALYVLFKEPEIDRRIFIVRHVIFRRWGQGVENPAPFEGADESYPCL